MGLPMQIYFRQKQVPGWNCSPSGGQPRKTPCSQPPQTSLKGRRPLTYAFRRAVDRLYVKKGLTTRFTYFFRNSDSRYT